MASKIKVLMVDDEERFRTTTSKILTRKGFDTVMAESGEEALTKLSEKPDVVILDVKMAGMDGHETLEQIKKTNPDLPVIMLTGHGDLASARESLKHGAFDYLTKPCDIDLLAAKVNDAAAHGRKLPRKEKSAGEIMIPLEDYHTIKSSSTVREAIELLRKSQEEMVSTDRIMDVGRRSLLVFEDGKKLVGILTPVSLMEAVRPDYLSAPKPSLADSIQYSHLFWTGLFTSRAKEVAGRQISEIMYEAPPTIDEDANLMEVADAMVSEGKRRLAVTRHGEVVGVVREQEVFYELAGIISGA